LLENGQPIAIAAEAFYETSDQQKGVFVDARNHCGSYSARLLFEPDFFLQLERRSQTRFGNRA
jgi:hypothetical protein